MEKKDVIIFNDEDMLIAMTEDTLVSVMENDEGETVVTSITDDEIEIETHMKDGWIKKVVYKKDGTKDTTYFK